eukprot:2089372-Pyramimonas_sp.AAC.1
MPLLILKPTKKSKNLVPREHRACQGQWAPSKHLAARVVPLDDANQAGASGLRMEAAQISD